MLNNMHKIFKCFSHFMQDEFMLCLPLASTDSCSKRNSKSSIMLKSRLSIYWIIDYNFCLPTLLNFHQIQSYYKFLFWNNLDTIIDIFKGTSLLIDNYVMFVYLLPVPLSQTRVATSKSRCVTTLNPFCVTTLQPIYVKILKNLRTEKTGPQNSTTKPLGLV
jgi:hypothetical protein